MKRIATLLMILTIALGNVNARQKYDVFLLIGQSNMAGRGRVLDDDRLPIDGVYMLGENDELIPACQPLNLYSTIRKGVAVQGYNLGDSFSRMIHRETGRKVLLVVNARGATEIAQWMKGAPQAVYSKGMSDDPEKYGKKIPSFYDEAVRRTLIALRYGKLKAILWHQGEDDAADGKREVYLDKMSQFVSDLRADLGVTEKVPFIVAEVHHSSRFTAINPVLREVDTKVPNSYCILTDGIPSNPDNLHFSREGAQQLGEKYAEVVLERVYRKK